VVFLIPWAWFWWKGYFDRTWAMRFLGGFCLGGLQGLMGWLMVASGLVDQPQVSHIRLAAHLMLALLILWYFWRLGWLYQNEAQKERLAVLEPAVEGIDKQKMFTSLARILNVLFWFLMVQIIYGAFVAGLRAGYMYNTFPDMEGQFFPSGAWMFEPILRNVFDNPLLVQWIHRTLGWAVFALSLWVYVSYRKVIPVAMRGVLKGLPILVVAQFLLGVFTLLLRVNLPLAVFHQVGACVLMMFILWLRWDVRYQSRRG
jgi:cytochrome c oxidase assembly protein subunit 15